MHTSNYIYEYIHFISALYAYILKILKIPLQFNAFNSDNQYLQLTGIALLLISYYNNNSY